jgi:hypothetical protein
VRATWKEILAAAQQDTNLNNHAAVIRALWEQYDVNCSDTIPVTELEHLLRVMTAARGSVSAMGAAVLTWSELVMLDVIQACDEAGLRRVESPAQELLHTESDSIQAAFCHKKATQAQAHEVTKEQPSNLELYARKSVERDSGVQEQVHASAEKRGDSVLPPLLLGRPVLEHEQDPRDVGEEDDSNHALDAHTVAQQAAKDVGQLQINTSAADVLASQITSYDVDQGGRQRHFGFTPVGSPEKGAKEGAEEWLDNSEGGWSTPPRGRSIEPLHSPSPVRSLAKETLTGLISHGNGVQWASDPSRSPGHSTPPRVARPLHFSSPAHSLEKDTLTGLISHGDGVQWASDPSPPLTSQPAPPLSSQVMSPGACAALELLPAPAPPMSPQLMGRVASAALELQETVDANRALAM